MSFYFPSFDLKNDFNVVLPNVSFSSSS